MDVNSLLKVENKIDEQCFSITSVSPFSPYVSPNRNYMGAVHREQALELISSEINITQSGLEKEMGSNTFSVTVERDCHVLKVIERCELRNNSEEIVELIIIVQDNEGFIDCYSIPYYFSLKKRFGFKYEMDVDFIRSLRYGTPLAKGTILADTGALHDGNLCLGVNANVAMLSIQGVAEDGVIVSKSFLDKLAFRTFHSTKVSFGSENFLLNMYGDESNYIPFPSVGSTIRKDGILCALRSYNKDDTLYATSYKDLMEHDQELDMRYVLPGGGETEPINGVIYQTGKVVDIEAFRNDAKLRSRQEFYPFVLGEIDRHVDNTENFYRTINEFYQTLIKTKDPRTRYNNKPTNPLKLSERFWNLVYKSMVITNKDGKVGSKIALTYKSTNQDIYVCNIVTEHIVKPWIGFKLTDSFGFQINRQVDIM